MTQRIRRSHEDWLVCDLLPHRLQALRCLAKSNGHGCVTEVLSTHARLGAVWSEALSSPRVQRLKTREILWMRRCKAWFFTPDDPLWRRSDWSPGVLRGRGQIPTGRRVGMVGARRADNYGQRLSHSLAGRLSKMGITIVSGGAYGIDIASHKGALDAGGKTVVVLGTGLEHAGPQAHYSVFEAAVESGALISPYASWQRGNRWTFVKRNQWIARLSEQLIVVQAGDKSGALYTAREALKRGQTVWVVPGRYQDSLHEGCHRLVDEGARILTQNTDLRAAFAEGNDEPEHGHADSRSHPSCPQIYRHVWDAIDENAPTLTQLADTLTMPLNDLVCAIAELEIAGWISREADGGLRRCSRPRHTI